MEHTVVCVFI